MSFTKHARVLAVSSDLICRLDGAKKIFQEGFSVLGSRLKERYYTSVAAFSADFSVVLSTTMGLPMAADRLEIEAHFAGDRELILEFRNRRTVAKRILRAVQNALQEAMYNESELSGRPFEKELRDLDLLCENGMRSRRDSIAGSLGEPASDHGREVTRLSNGTTDEWQNNNDLEAAQDSIEVELASKSINQNHHPTPDDSNSTPPSNGINIGHHMPNGTAELPGGRSSEDNVGPPTPPLSSAGQLQALSGGGIPWYMEPFDPDGTTIHEERWTGRELVRGMSEELSDMDEAELSGLVIDETAEAPQGQEERPSDAERAAKAEARRKAAARRKRNRGW